MEVRLNGFGTDFEGFIEVDTVLPTTDVSAIRSIMGAIDPSNSVEIKFRWSVGYAMVQEQSSMRCDYTNKTCFSARAVAVIQSIDAVGGYTTGGQLLKITGHGFASGTIDAKVDGKICRVVSQSTSSFSCVTSAKPDGPTAGSYFLG
jgi:hypothetical protein